MELSQSERIALGIARNDGNHAPMTKRDQEDTETFTGRYGYITWL